MKKFIKRYSKKLNKNPYKITLGYPGPSIVNEVKKKAMIEFTIFLLEVLLTGF